MRPIRSILLLSCWLFSAVAWAQTGPATADSLSSLATPPANSLATTGGVRYVVLQPGSGAPSTRVAVYYQGFLPDGRIFDSTLAPAKPLRLRVGRGEVIRGWDELLGLLPPGSRVRAWIPARLAYGSQGVRHPDDDSRYLIPPDTDLRFDIELLPAR
ncbi:FKBP-type peptidyl-prolyl cis-trans isomerase [Hymenobacter canadensis]|uniref:Peptidyl-prolyl cis-trans isomerase n=1 Tax=Hymenobacter canadensis TaxID=2999067 RepID=A0ABY7LQG8_9BACT|nr:FKBP-type peptidyl-prolyl cis-trans isomerase [Hymenobacter canadensis]WBA41692.1 FKBP-type peptidyl-prolyl cis-trans isomerase [Hymenobacter canadensis]